MLSFGLIQVPVGEDLRHLKASSIDVKIGATVSKQTLILGELLDFFIYFN